MLMQLPQFDTLAADPAAGDLVPGLAILRGEKEASRVYLPPDWPDVRATRAKTGLTRKAFAARTLLRVIEKEPEVVKRALRVA